MALIASASKGQRQEGFALEMFGGPSGTINSFGSQEVYNAMRPFADLAFEAGAGVSFRNYAGEGKQWGLKLSASRLAFGYAEADSIVLNGMRITDLPVSTRRIYLNVEPLYSFRIASASGFDLELESSLGIKLPINAYTLAEDAQSNNVDINDFDQYSYGELTVFKAQLAPCMVWSATRLSLFGAYQISSGAAWEALSGWSAGFNISYFIEE